MRIHANSPERKNPSELSFLIKSIIIGVVIAAFLILSGITIKALVLFTMDFTKNYWMWMIGATILLLLLRKFLGKKK